MSPSLLLRHACVALALSCHSSARETIPAPPPERLDVSQRPRVVLVQPVIVCDDDGGNPARSAFPKTLVDQVYTRAGLEFLYLEPRRWNNGAARRGEINLDRIVSLAKSSAIIPADPRVVTMIFVSGVDGNKRPLGRGQQNGNICFVSSGTEEPMTDPAMQAFVVAHEVGHCLGLVHAVDDPAVPDDVPNLQGEGPFDRRLAVEGLHPSQVATILKSPLVVERLKFLTRDEAARELVDEAWFPFMKTNTDDVLRFALGLAADAPVPRGKLEKEQFARLRHSAMAMEFTTKEIRVLRQTVERIRTHLAGDWPMISRLPWHFVKTRDGFCNNFPHTRGLVTVVSETALRGMLADPGQTLELVFHEKIHVVQRLNPGRFASLYRSFGYTPVRLAEGEERRLNLIQNPDAPVNDWAASTPSGAVLIATSFHGGEGGLGFAENYHRLSSRPDGTSVIGPVIEDTADIDAWRDRFPIRIGYDHPNEVFAYLCGEILRQRMAGEREAPENKIMDAMKGSLDDIFRLDGN